MSVLHLSLPCILVPAAPAGVHLMAVCTRMKLHHGITPGPVLPQNPHVSALNSLVSVGLALLDLPGCPGLPPPPSLHSGCCGPTLLLLLPPLLAFSYAPESLQNFLSSSHPCALLQTASLHWRMWQPAAQGAP